MMAAWHVEDPLQLLPPVLPSSVEENKPGVAGWRTNVCLVSKQIVNCCLESSSAVRVCGLSKKLLAGRTRRTSVQLEMPEDGLCALT